MQLTKVYAIREDLHITAQIASETYRYVTPGILWDSDQTVVEDDRGYRFKRQPALTGPDGQQVFAKI